MTIGERIKYHRKQINITQDELAKLTGIHPVTIRKYETDKTTPKSPQIIRIAEALGVSPFAITGDDDIIRLETRGDLIGLLIMLCKNNVITIEGERQENDMLAPDTVSVRINPLIAKAFSAAVEKKSTDADSITYALKNKEILRKLLLWEQADTKYKKIVAELGGSQDKEYVEALKQVKEQKDIIEMTLMHTNYMLDTTDGLTVKNPGFVSG